MDMRCALDQSAEGGASGGVSRDSVFFFFYSYFILFFSFELYYLFQSILFLSLIFDKPTSKNKIKQSLLLYPSIRNLIHRKKHLQVTALQISDHDQFGVLIHNQPMSI